MIHPSNSLGHFQIGCEATGVVTFPAFPATSGSDWNQQNSADSIDYPDPAYSTAKSVSEHSSDEGILICGTGIGMSIVANKLPGIRAALCYSVETAQLSRKHNNANLLCLGARVEHSDSVEKIVDEWLNAKFEEGRHERRVDKIHSLTGR